MPPMRPFWLKYVDITVVVNIPTFLTVHGRAVDSARKR